MCAYLLWTRRKVLAMDVKVSARSKRASSQRGRARHSNPKHSLKPAPAHQEQPASDSKASPLPSNWSRYEEEEALEVEPFTDLPAVKSKGADYRDLLIRSSSTSNFDNPDWTGGRRSLMLTRGLDLSSMGIDADTFWNRKETSADEASFLSLDLDFLGNELANVDLAERLFIDPKFVPAEKRKKSIIVKCEDITAEAQDENQLLLDSLTSDSGLTVPENYLKALSMPSRVLGLDSSLSKSAVSEAHHVSGDLLGTIVTKDSIGGHPESSRSASKVVATQGVSDCLQTDEIVAHLKEITTQPLKPLVSEAHYVLDDLLGSRVTEDSINAQPESPKYAAEGVITQGVIDSLKTDEKIVLLKETTTESQNVEHSKLEAKAAEAELDALLDMIDHHHLRDSATVFPSTLPGSVNGQGSTSGEVGYSEVPQQASSANLSEDAFFGTLISSMESLDGISFNANKPPEQGRMSGVTPGQILSFSTPDNGKGSLDVDEDFDKWLDSL